MLLIFKAKLEGYFELLIDAEFIKDKSLISPKIIPVGWGLAFKNYLSPGFD